MIILGNAGMLEYHAMKRERNDPEGKPGMWKPVIDLMRKKNRILPGIPIFCQNHPDDRSMICEPCDFDKYAADGGCMKPCGGRMPCGHACPKKCHPDDRLD
jgi:hypothetical protein